MPPPNITLTLLMPLQT